MRIILIGLLSAALLGLASSPARAWLPGAFPLPGAVVVAPAPAPWYPYGYGYAPYSYPSVYSPGWVNGYGFESHVPGEWATSAYWDSTGPHVHAYTLH
ncbi:MAG TPA: hypothetical protein VKW76_08755 [Candidatus Binatia bacterium]|nr:hypothetical protein [Candidatus Binatia bacterium]